MRLTYIIVISILFIISVIFEYHVLFKGLGEHPNLANAIQAAAIFIALFAAIIALSTANPKKKIVKVTIEHSIDKMKVEECLKKDLSTELKEVYKDFPDPIRSHQVHFEVSNSSGFSLKRPTLTFKLPLGREHPETKGRSPYTRRTFHSNLFYSRSELRVLDFADTRIISNSNLPYWNDNDKTTIWIRMVLDDGKLEPFNIEVSVNCENAEGVTKKISIDPKKLTE
jgi:hypothetical protein